MKRILVTGATHGMGLGVARALASKPDTEVIVLGRSAEHGRATVEALSALASPERISFVACDLSRLAEVHAAIDTLRSAHDRLDAIFVNAGLGYAPEHRLTEDGHDAHFQVNYLSHFLLTLNLLDLLERSEHGGRVVFNATEPGEVHWDDLRLQRDWGYEEAIYQGMAAKRLFYARLHALYASGDRPRVSCFGFRIHKTVWTNQLALIPWYMRAMATLAKWFGQFISIDTCGEIMAPLFLEDGATSLTRSGRLLTWKDEAFCDFEPAPMSDPADQERLWRVSLELCDDARTTQIAAALEG
jgi:hypothetical protein